MPLTYTKAQRIELKSSAEFDEAWLQARIAEDPGILGFGDVMLLERERSQGSRGRLDLLLSDPEQNRRYEVELMLGATDPSHIIRTIEYWDVERRRYPAYDHVGVLVAEDITARFLNVLSLFSGSIPLVAIQLNALRVGENIVLDFVKVLDQTELRVDDEEEAAERSPKDRAYWEQNASNDTLRLVDDMLALINERAARAYQLSYNQRAIGLNDGNRSRPFVYFFPRKHHVRFRVRVSDPDGWIPRFEESGLEPTVNRRGRLVLSLTRTSFDHNRELVRELLHQAVECEEG